MAWEWPTHVINLRAYLEYSEENVESNVKLANHVQIRHEVLVNNDWSFLPRAPDIAARDLRTLKMAAAWIFKHPMFAHYKGMLAAQFKSWCVEHSHRKFDVIGGARWYLDEPPIYAVYKRLLRWSSDETSGNRKGLWRLEPG